MTPAQDRALAQLGITQWTLRRPETLQGEVAISVPDHVRLLVIAETLPDLDTPLLRDVLAALNLSKEQVYALNQQQAAMLPEETQCHSWRIGLETPLNILGVQLSSPLLDQLAASPAAKKALWLQICQNESDLYPQ